MLRRCFSQHLITILIVMLLMTILRLSIFSLFAFDRFLLFVKLIKFSINFFLASFSFVFLFDLLENILTFQLEPIHLRSILFPLEEWFQIRICLHRLQFTINNKCGNEVPKYAPSALGDFFLGE